MKFFAVALLAVILIGCQGMNWAVTPSVGVSGDQYGNTGWYAGVAFGISSTNTYVPPPVIHNTTVKISNSNSVSQSQSQNQSQNQQSSNTCSLCGHEHGHGHNCEDD